VSQKYDPFIQKLPNSQSSKEGSPKYGIELWDVK
jgi:hypothetical protein